MKIALMALTALLPALASADDPKPYVVYQGRAVRAAPAPTAAADPAAAPQMSAAKQTSAFGTNSIQAGVTSGTSRAAAGRSAGNPRAFRGVGRSSRRRGIVGSTPIGTPPPATPASTTDAPPAYAVPGAKIISAGQQPVYSDPGNGGTHSVEGGGFIAIDQSRAHDVGRAPGISWAPPDTPPSATSLKGSGTGASSNGPAAVSQAPAAPPTTPTKTDHRDDSATGFNPAF